MDQEQVRIAPSLFTLGPNRFGAAPVLLNKVPHPPRRHVSIFTPHPHLPASQLARRATEPVRARFFRVNGLVQTEIVTVPAIVHVHRRQSCTCLYCPPRQRLLDNEAQHSLHNARWLRIRQ